MGHVPPAVVPEQGRLLLRAGNRYAEVVRVRVSAVDRPAGDRAPQQVGDPGVVDASRIDRFKLARNITIRKQLHGSDAVAANLRQQVERPITRNPEARLDALPDCRAIRQQVVEVRLHDLPGVGSGGGTERHRQGDRTTRGQ